MCGIFGYYNYLVDRDRATILSFLINGLRRLEYRGYDSSGICIDGLEAKVEALCNGNGVHIEPDIKSGALTFSAIQSCCFGEVAVILPPSCQSSARNLLHIQVTSGYYSLCNYPCRQSHKSPATPLHRQWKVKRHIATLPCSLQKPLQADHQSET